MATRVLYPLIAIGVILLVSLRGLNAQQSPGATISIGSDDIGGVVTSTKGPEAGVWVIAETADLPTKFVKIVVTDDSGRTLLPQLPKANYKVWVRGYGLVDSPPVQGGAWQGCQSDCGSGAERACSSAILPGHLLVFRAPCAGQKPVPRHWAQRQRHPGKHDKSGPMAAFFENRQLLVLSEWGTIL
jgi:hypothetical protein